MTENLLSGIRTALKSAEVRILLAERIGGPGQYSGGDRKRNRLYLPRAGAGCRLVLIFRDDEIDRIEPGQAFNRAEWETVALEVEGSMHAGTLKVGRDYSFSSSRVLGSWRGEVSGLQILPPPEDAPRAPVEHDEHPFILEFPLKESGVWLLTNYRRMQALRRFTALLNVLLPGRTFVQSPRADHFWSYVTLPDGTRTMMLVQPFIFAPPGAAILDELSPLTGERLEEISTDELSAYDGKGLRIPTDLDNSIHRYLQLSPANGERFDRAAFWFDMASSVWPVSISSSLTSLISAIESVIGRGGGSGAKRFRAFLDYYAGDAALKGERSDMYSLRNRILHGSKILQLDQGRHFGWDPPWSNDLTLHEHLWRVTRVALRNWLTQPLGKRNRV